MSLNTQNNSELPKDLGSEYNKNKQSFYNLVLEFYQNFSGIKKLEVASYTDNSVSIIIPDKELAVLERTALWIKMTELFVSRFTGIVYRITLSNNELNLINLSYDL
jgi:hypothetical protein